MADMPLSSMISGALPPSAFGAPSSRDRDKPKGRCNVDAGGAPLGRTPHFNRRLWMTSDDRPLIFLGVDIGKSAHYAVAVDRDGQTVYSKPVANEESALRLLV